jgi:two-component system, NtrC family, nitrogen regulation sensor histidine kinase NtrY
MKLQYKFILYIVFIHAIALVLSYFVFEKNKILFIVSEAVILVSVGLSWSLYNDLINPLQLLLRGTDAMRDRDFNVRFVPTGKYEMDKLIGVYNEMIDQLRTERTLQEEQHFFLEKLIQTSPTGIIMLDYDQKVDSINPKAAALLDLPNQHHPILQPGHAFLKTIVEQPMGTANLLSMGGVKKYKVQKAQFISRGFPRAFVMIEELTAEILEAEKTAYGKVIRMMAHEVNNSIGAINSIIDTVLLRPKSAALQARDFEALQIAYDRNEHLNQFMRRFADVVRLPALQKEKFNLHDLLHNVAVLIGFKAKERGVHFVFELADQPFWINADMQQMEQVLINIVKNAIEAIEQSGSITFSTTLNPPQLSITNTGKGIDEAVAPLLFSPFFTTKNTGQGVGLTLIREILSSHQFGFSLATVATEETVFKIRF